jgi:2'-5' RNA ligase
MTTDRRSRLRVFPGQANAVWTASRLLRGAARRADHNPLTQPAFRKIVAGLDTLAARPVVGAAGELAADILSRSVEHPLTRRDVLTICRSLEDAGCQYWLGGGWGIDALVGTQSRDHHDLDIILDDFHASIPMIETALAGLGYRRWSAHEGTMWLPHTAVFEDIAGRRIEVLGIDWEVLATARPLVSEPDDAGGPGRDASDEDHSDQRPDGAPRWKDNVFSAGSLDATPLPCLSAAAQALFHTGYIASPKDRRDVELLRMPDVSTQRTSVAGPALAGRSTLLIPVFDLPAPLRRLHRGLNGVALPPHITLLYPFLPTDQLTPERMSAIRKICQETTAFEFCLDEVRWFDSRVVYLAPDTPGPFVDLVQRVMREFPECIPYDGAHREIIPHLTLAEDQEVHLARRCAVRASRQLPILLRAQEVWLMSELDDRWRIHQVLRLADSPSSLG